MSVFPTYTVQQFMVLMGQDVGAEYTNELLRFRERLIREEVAELDHEIDDACGCLLAGEKVPASIQANIIKELTDLLYVVAGFAVTFGIDLEEAFRRVHKSNLSKLDDEGKPIYREDGKVLKGPNYAPAWFGDMVK